MLLRIRLIKSVSTFTDISRLMFIIFSQTQICFKIQNSKLTDTKQAFK